jgi:predicted DNA binding CopG/RHH family protein
LKLNERKSNINLAGRMSKFKTEAEEAHWWDQHEDVAVEMLQDAWPAMFKVKVPTESISLRLPATQLAAVRKYAARSGVGYQTLLKRFIDIGVRSLGVGVLTHTMEVPVGVGKAARKRSTLHKQPNR